MCQQTCRLASFDAYHYEDEKKLSGNLQEYFLEDLLDILQWAASAMPHAMDALPNNEFVNLVIVFLGSPAYIKNAHLRAKLIDVRPAEAPTWSRLSQLAICNPHPFGGPNGEMVAVQ